MTIEQRLEELEQQNQKMQRTNKRLTTALTMTVVAMCAVVTVAAAGENIGVFNTVVARSIFVMNDAGEIVVALGATDNASGLVSTRSAKGRDLVTPTATVNGGVVKTYQRNGKELVSVGTSDRGGAVYVYNKTGEGIAQMGADDYGNGYVGAYNRYGKGRTLKPGP